MMMMNQQFVIFLNYKFEQKQMINHKSVCCIKKEIISLKKTRMIKKKYNCIAMHTQCEMIDIVFLFIKESDYTDPFQGFHNSILLL